MIWIEFKELVKLYSVLTLLVVFVFSLAVLVITTGLAVFFGLQLLEIARWSATAAGASGVAIFFWIMISAV